MRNSIVVVAPKRLYRAIESRIRPVLAQCALALVIVLVAVSLVLLAVFRREIVGYKNKVLKPYVRFCIDISFALLDVVSVVAIILVLAAYKTTVLLYNGFVVVWNNAFRLTYEDAMLLSSQLDMTPMRDSLRALLDRL